MILKTFGQKPIADWSGPGLVFHQRCVVLGVELSTALTAVSGDSRPFPGAGWTGVSWQALPQSVLNHLPLSAARALCQTSSAICEFSKAFPWCLVSWGCTLRASICLTAQNSLLLC